MMDKTLMVVGGLLAFTWVWLSMVAVVSVCRDPTLDSFQKKAQIGVVFLLPIIGAAFVTLLIRQHSPEAIPKALAPWPLSLFFRDYPVKLDEGSNGGEGIGLHTMHYGRDMYYGGGDMDSGGDGGN